MKRIFIGGDSWGTGELPGQISPSVVRVPHKGIEQYLRSDGHYVNNSSAIGVSNTDSIAALAQEFYLDAPSDYVFWFQSDPLRDLRPYDTAFKNRFTTYQQLVDISNELLDASYRYLQSFNFPIYCLGGCSTLNLDLMSKYSNLIPLIPSVTKFIYPDYDHPMLWQSGWLVGHERQFSIDELDLVIADREKQLALHDNRYARYFRPDGQHPNREGHRLIYSYICQTLHL